MKNKKISLSKFKELRNCSLEKVNAFYENQLNKTQDELSLVLKSHLYLEHIIDQILVLILPHSKKILKERRFSDKVEILRALGIFDPHKNLLEKIKMINNIRNNFAHDLKYKLSSKDLRKFLKETKIKKEMSNRQKFIVGAIYLLSFLSAMKDYIELTPFLQSCIRNHKLFKNDMVFDLKEIIKNYNNKGLKKAIEALQIKL